MQYAHRHRSIRSALAHLFHPRRSNNHRARLLHPEGFLVLGAIVAFCFGIIRYPTAAQKDLGLVLGYASDISVDQVIAQTNKERQTAGLVQLTENQKLAQAAQAKAADMFSKQYWAHTSPVGREPWDFMHDSGYTYRRAGENLARDFLVTPDMVAAWMASPTHRANIMNGGFSEIGVAVVNGTLDGVETTLVVQMFGTPPTVAQAPQVPSAAVVTQQEASETNSAQQATKQVLAQEQDTVNSIKPSQETVTVITEGTTSQAANIQSDTPTVLAGQAVPVGVVQPRILYSPLHIAKAVALAVVVLLVTTLVYDGLAAHFKQTPRLVGKNLAHVCLFLTVAFIVVFFKGGMVQ